MLNRTQLRITYTCCLRVCAHAAYNESLRYYIMCVYVRDTELNHTDRW